MVKILFDRIRIVTNLIKTYCDLSNNKIMKYLNVAEKNDAAKNVAAILSNSNSRRVSIRINSSTLIILINVIF